jgi:hypothetical protein
MRRTVLIGLALTFGCGKSEPKPEPKPAPVKPEPPEPVTKPAAPPVDAAPPAPTGPKQVEVKLEPSVGTPVKVRVKVPGDFTATPYGASAKNQYGEAESGVDFTVTCDGECTPAKLPDVLAKLVAHGPESASKPNFNTGDPKLDAVRLDVATLDHGDIPGGKFIVYRVTKPKDLEGPYREAYHALCGKMLPGNDRFIYAQAWTSIAAEKTVGPAIVEACKTFELLP